MLTPLTERQATLIINNVVSACKDITALNKTGYNFLYLAQGYLYMHLDLLYIFHHNLVHHEPHRFLLDLQHLNIFQNFYLYINLLNI